MLTTPRALAEARGDLRVRSRSRVRWVAEVAVVLLAAVAVLLLTRRGLVAASTVVGTDPLLAAAPVLLAAASCVVALRIYPIPLRAAQRAQRGRRGAAGLLGAARAVRDPALGFVAALAMVVGIFVVIFSTDHDLDGRARARSRAPATTSAPTCRSRRTICPSRWSPTSPRWTGCAPP